MTHTEAASASPTKIALRADRGCLVLYSGETDCAVIQAYGNDDLWFDVPLDLCERYRDWEPAPDTLYEKVRRAVRWVKGLLA